MVNFVKELMDEQSNPVASLLQILVSDYDKYDVVAAVEGDDDRIFYYDFLTSYLFNRRILIVDCGGKRGVIVLKSLVEEYRWDKHPCIYYLCDKDFDDLIGLLVSGVHYIPCYSIENYFSTPEFFRYCVSRFPRGHINSSNQKVACETFSRVFAALIRLSRTWAAMMLAVRKQGVHPDFDKISVNDVFDMTCDVPRLRRNRWDRIHDLLELDEKISLADVLREARLLNVNSYHSWLRGKFALQLARFALRLTERAVDESLRAKLPTSNCFTSESFKISKSYLVELPSLAVYCK